MTVEEFKGKLDAIIDHYLSMGQMDFYESQLCHATVEQIIVLYNCIYNAPQSMEEYTSQEADCIH